MSKHLTAADLPGDLGRFADGEVAAGHFASVEDVVEAGLTMLQKRQQRHAEKLATIGAAIDEGERSGLFEGDPFASVRAELGLPQRR